MQHNFAKQWLHSIGLEIFNESSVEICLKTGTTVEKQ